MARAAGTAQKGRRADVELLTMHRDMLLKRLNLLKTRHVRFNVLTTDQGFESYSDYLAQLRDVKASSMRTGNRPRS